MGLPDPEKQSPSLSTPPQKLDFQPVDASIHPSHHGNTIALDSSSNAKAIPDNEKSFARLTPVPSSTSTVEEAIDAEAGFTNLPQPQRPATAKSGGDGDDPGPPPNGGFAAWLQVAGSFFLFFNCWGTGDTNQDWKETASNISWIGSTQAFLLLLVGVISGPVYDAGYFRLLIIMGTFLIPFGFMMTSLTHTYWQVMLAQAFLIGLGNGCVFVPSVAIIPQYFSTRKALANGIAASGSSIGGIIYPIVFRRLQQSVGFPWATRVLGFISLATLTFSLFVMKPRIIPRGRRKLVDFSAFKEVPYVVFCFAMFLAFTGFYGPIFYIQPYAIQNNLTSENFAFNLLPILNAASVPGRIFPNFLADYAGPLNILVPCAILTGVLALCWIGIHNIAGLIVFGILYGFFSGGFVSMPPVAVVSLTPDMRTLGTRMGQCFFFSAFGLLCGTPVSGAILKSTGSWLGVQLFSGVTIFLTGCLLVWARVAAKGWSVRIKA